MTLNTESESITIKRLEIALRKMDIALLKTAGYKLHEKFHAGHKFEYIVELKQILKFLETQRLDEEISELITSTIMEILDRENGEKINFTTQEPEIVELPEEKFTETSVQPYKAAPIEDIKPVYSSTPIPLYSAPLQTRNNEGINNKNMAIFYEEKNQEIDFRLIKEYKNYIASNAQTNTLLGHLKMILNILSSDLSSLNRILSTFSTLKNKINLITTSMNSNLLEQLKFNSINFNIPYVFENNIQNCWNFYPIYGQTAIFECQNCGKTFLNANGQNVMAMACPKCSEISFPQLNLSNSIDAKPVQGAFDALLNSQIWVLINPPYGENAVQMQNLFELAYKNAKPKRIYLLSQDGERKEFYKQMFYSISQNCEIKTNFLTDENFCDEFINTEIKTGIYG